MVQVNVDKALEAGLSFRPLEETIRDTAAWEAGRPSDAPRKAGLVPQREAELLAEWHSRQGD
ncbi:hypothetical protein D3C75_1245140 [compost metagenome]